MAFLHAVDQAAAFHEDAAAAPTTGPSLTSIQALKDEGNARFNAGDLPAAFQAYSQCIDVATFALNAEPLCSKGAPAFLGEGLSPAKNLSQELKKLLAAAYCNRSMCHLKQQNLRGAAADSWAALEVQPDYEKALYRHAVALRLLGDTAGAVASLNRLLRVDPKNADGARLLLELKDHLLKQEQEQQDSKLPSRLLEIATDGAASERTRVKALRDLGRLMQARQSLQEALAKEGLVKQLAVFLKQMGAMGLKDSAATTYDSAVAASSTPAALAFPAAVEAAGWELAASAVQFSPLGPLADDACSSNASRERILFKINEPLTVPSHIKLCRESFRKVWTSEDFLLALRRLLKQEIANPPKDGFASIFDVGDGSTRSGASSSRDHKRWRGFSAVFLLRVLGYLKQSEPQDFEHDASFLGAVSYGLDCSEAPAVQLAALQALAAAADARRRLGLKAKALALRHGIERSLEAALRLLSAAADTEACGSPATETRTIQKNVELTVVTILSLLGDKERAETDRVDMQRLADQLLAPFLACCSMKDPSRQADSFVGLKALQFFITADRQCAREFILQGSLLPYILSAATGEAAAGAGLSGTQHQRQQQHVGTEVLLHCLDHLELRQKLLDDDGLPALLKLVRDELTPEIHRAKLAVALARICVHSKTVNEEVLHMIDLAGLLEELLLQILKQQENGTKRKSIEESFAHCVLELFFFLSFHAEFKRRLLETSRTSTGQMNLLSAVLEVGTQYCGSISSNTNLNSSTSLPRYLLCAGLCNLMKSRSDKERRPKRSGLRGGMDLDESQLKDLEAFYEQLPAEAKPLPNGEIDAGDEATIAALRELLLQKGAAKLLVKACGTKPLPSPNVLLAAGTAFFLLSKNENARGLLVREGALRTLLTAIGALRATHEDMRDLQQAAAQLCISINPALFSYHDSLDLVPALLPLLSDNHELLQYESCLALTNLLSVNEELRLRAFSGGAWSLFRDILFGDNDMLRAAALEGWCNLASSPKVQESIGEKVNANSNVEDLRLMLAFCLESNNPRAQQAAAGVLATLLNNSVVARALPSYDNYLNLFKALEEADEHQGPLLDRLVACLVNVWGEYNEEHEKTAVQLQIQEAIARHKHKMKGLAANLASQIIAAEKR